MNYYKYDIKVNDCYGYYSYNVNFKYVINKFLFYINKNINYMFNYKNIKFDKKLCSYVYNIKFNIKNTFIYNIIKCVNFNKFSYNINIIRNNINSVCRVFIYNIKFNKWRK